MSIVNTWAKHYKNLHKKLTFLLFGFYILAAFQVAWVIPPFQIPDEDTHWFTALARTSMNCSVESSLPSFYEVNRIKSNPQEKITPGRMDQVSKIQSSCTTEWYPYGSFLTYFGVHVAKWVLPSSQADPMNAVIFYYFSKMVQGLLLVFVLGKILWRISKTYGSMPGFLCIQSFMLSPLFLQQSFAMTSDVVVEAAALVFIDLLLFWNQINWLDLALVLLVGFASMTTKPMVLPALLAVWWVCFLFSSSGKISKFNSVQKAVSLSLLALVFIAAFYTLKDAGGITTRFHFDPKGQLKYFFHHIGSSFKVVYRGVEAQMNVAYLSGPLGWLDTSLGERTLNRWVKLLQLAFILDFILVFLPWRKFQLPKLSVKAIVGSIAAAALLFSAFWMTSFAQYLRWTPVGTYTVLGVQGRYFFPSILVTLGMMAFAVQKLHPVAIPTKAVSAKNQIRIDQIAQGFSYLVIFYFILFFIKYCISIDLDLARRFY